MFKFIEVYCGAKTLLKRGTKADDFDEYFDSYDSYISCFILFCIAFKHNLWLSNVDDFVKGQYFMKSDIQSMISLLKPLIVSLVSII